MVSLVFAAFVLAAPPPGEGDSPPESAAAIAAEPSQRTVTQPTITLRQRVHAGLKRTAPLLGKNASTDDLAQAACELLPLYDELRRDQKMADPDRQQLGGIVRGRLKKIEKQLAARLADHPDGLSLAVRVQVEAVDSALADAPPGDGDGDTISPGVAASQANVNFGGQVGQGGQGIEDAGQALVELIQATIAPESWDVNGGPGTIMYYPPLRVLVVRQTGEVQGQVGGVLGQLQGISAPTQYATDSRVSARISRTCQQGQGPPDGQASRRQVSHSHHRMVGARAWHRPIGIRGVVT